MEEKELFDKKGNKDSDVKKITAVMSGKGGVGKSLVTSLLAVLSGRSGKKTAVLDADITGPSIPKSFGLRGRLTGDDSGIFPAETGAGIKIVSMNMLLEDESAPVVWRGPIISGTVRQFWTDVEWGDVDNMYVDMPPGTGDVPLTVFQSLPVNGIVVVTSPQDLVSMIVEKAVKMAEMMKIPVLGIIENMSYFECDGCGKKHFIFGRSRLEEIAERHEIKLTARIPLDPGLAGCVDSGKIEKFDGKWLGELEPFIKAL